MRTTRSKHVSVCFTLGIIGIILSVCGLIILGITIPHQLKQPILLKCNVENFINDPKTRLPFHDYTTKCKFINLNPIQDTTILGPCGFDQYHDIIYGRLPTNYQAKYNTIPIREGYNKANIELATDIFRLPCGYSVDTYCPSSHLVNRVLDIELIPITLVDEEYYIDADGYINKKWQMVCIKNETYVIGVGLSLLLMFTISFIMFIADFQELTLSRYTPDSAINTYDNFSISGLNTNFDNIPLIIYKKD